MIRNWILKYVSQFNLLSHCTSHYFQVSFGGIFSIWFTICLEYEKYTQSEKEERQGHRTPSEPPILTPLEVDQQPLFIFISLNVICQRCQTPDREFRSRIVGIRGAFIIRVEIWDVW
jgi:hypothetical protein